MSQFGIKPGSWAAAVSGDLDGTTLKILSQNLDTGEERTITEGEMRNWIRDNIAVDYSESEQVWPYATWFGETIYWRTWDLGDGDQGNGIEQIALTGIDPNDLKRVISAEYWGSLADPNSGPGNYNWRNDSRTGETGSGIRLTPGIFSGSLETDAVRRHYARYITVWYTKN